MKSGLFETNIIGDNLEEIKAIPTGKVNQIITSGPYDKARTYTGFPSLTMRRIRDLGRESYRVLTDDGVLCWNVNDMEDGFGGDSLTSFRHALMFQRIGFHVKPMFWEKSVFNPDGDFYYDVKEYVFVCFKNKNKKFNPILDIEKNKDYRYFGEFANRQKDGSFQKKKKKKKKEYVEEYKKKAEDFPFRKRGNIWKGNTAAQEYPCQPTYGHAPMPEWLVRDLMTSFSNPGDVVMDYFSGGGTTWKIARELGRSIITIEISEKIHGEAIERLSHVNPVMF